MADGYKHRISKKGWAQIFGACWNDCTTRGHIDGSRFSQNIPITHQVIEYYFDDLNILKSRYDIPESAQVPKKAGIMASAILRLRPIHPTVIDYPDKSTAQEAVTELWGGNPANIYANEIFAYNVGLAVCAQSQEYECASMQRQSWYSDWRNRLLYHWRYRNYTTESNIRAFDTISRIFLPKATSVADSAREENVEVNL